MMHNFNLPGALRDDSNRYKRCVCKILRMCDRGALDSMPSICCRGPRGHGFDSCWQNFFAIWFCVFFRCHLSEWHVLVHPGIKHKKLGRYRNSWTSVRIQKVGIACMIGPSILYRCYHILNYVFMSISFLLYLVLVTLHCSMHNNTYMFCCKDVA